MNVEQKLFETWCNAFTLKFKKNWEFYCLSSDAYINGYKDFREKLVADLKAKYEDPSAYSMSIDGVIELLEKFGEDKHTVFIADHQLGSKSTDGGHNDA